MRKAGGVKRRNDIILIVMLVAIACVLSMILYIKNEDSDILTVEVSVDGQVIDTYPLGTDEKYNTQCQLDIGNYLVIEGGYVYLKDADCPDKLCVKQGRISKAGESIICLPHHLVIRIVGESSNETEGLDVMPR